MSAESHAGAPHCTVSRYLAQRLAEMGVGHIFAVPGDYAGHFLSTIDGDPGLGIARVGTTNELVAGYSADAYARLRGAGAACVTFGVGTFSLLNALAGSYVEEVPVVLVVGSPASQSRTTERREGVLFHHSTGTLSADEDSVKNVTVARVVVRDPLTAPGLIDRALEACLTWRRPVYVEVLQNVWNLPCAAPHHALRPGPLPTLQGSVDAALDATLEHLWKAERPVIWAGMEVQRFGLQDLLLEIVEETGFPFASDLLGKGLVPENTPGFVGCYDGASANEKTRALMETADWVLGLGTLVTDDFLDLVKKSYGTMTLACENSVRVGTSVWDCAPLKAFMEGLLRRLRAKKYGAPEDAVALLCAVAAPPMLMAKSAGGVAEAEDPPVTYDGFFARMRDWVDESMVLMADTTIALYSAAELPVDRRDGFIAQAAWNSIGYTTGACLGVGFADPSRRAVVFSGDGGFQMVCQALSDVVRAKHGAIVFVFDNALYGIEQAFVNVKFFTQGEDAEAFDLLHRWNYAALPEVFGGGWGTTVETMGQLDEALRRAKENTGSLSLVALRIDERDITPQMLALAG
ncbi:alpha-keto acid decarboxylase family protein [Longimicrobium sp.]|uniref:alpha-keto acid decarboxylase family protein n=1 Tax=Longimicrobium sp. TaxID=2029185 RepID=UPI002C95C480|nr:thiamine pyrophosphate-binding protein [Longimicrobium sp.]HSU14638.1 thiamine pyrophosphate-binding protein [Longimicrobium sp.]